MPWLGTTYSSTATVGRHAVGGGTTATPARIARHLNLKARVYMIYCIYTLFYFLSSGAYTVGLDLDLQPQPPPPPPFITDKTLLENPGSELSF